MNHWIWRGARAASPCLLLSAALTLWAGEAGAELVFFSSGRTLSVSGHRLETDDVILQLRDGGEVTCRRSLITRITEDEVPRPAALTAPTRDVALSPAVPATVDGTRPFADLIAAAATAHGVDPRLIHAVVEAESNYQATARSRRGATGLMQLMPGTARQYAVRNPFDPAANLEAGVRHLKGLLARFELPVALAAYNAGEATVRRYGGMPPFAETRSYVRQILARLAVG